MKPMMKLYLSSHKFSELWNYFLKFHQWEILLGVICVAVYIVTKYKKDCKILKIILVQGFVHLENWKNPRFPIGFRLNTLIMKK